MISRTKRASAVISEEAKVVRDHLLHCHAYSSGRCLEASVVLGYRLKSRGVETRLVQGNVRPDKGFDQFHYWLEYKGIIIDVTGDQFNRHLASERRIPDILLTRYRNVKGLYLKGFDQEIQPHDKHGGWARSICTCSKAHH